MAGAPKGNQNAAKARVWRGAIERALKKRGKGDMIKALDELAEQFVDAVSHGDLAAFREFGDRMDGKPAQVITGEDGPLIPTNLKISFVKPKS